MNNIVAFSHLTRAGTFWVRLERDGLWHAWFEDEDLGAYKRPTTAAQELASGVTHWPSCGDPSDWGVPEELEDWQAHSAR